MAPGPRAGRVPPASGGDSSQQQQSWELVAEGGSRPSPEWGLRPAVPADWAQRARVVSGDVHVATSDRPVPSCPAGQVYRVGLSSSRAEPVPPERRQPRPGDGASPSRTSRPEQGGHQPSSPLAGSPPWSARGPHQVHSVARKRSGWLFGWLMAAAHPQTLAAAPSWSPTAPSLPGAQLHAPDRGSSRPPCRLCPAPAERGWTGRSLFSGHTLLARHVLCPEESSAPPRHEAGFPWLGRPPGVLLALQRAPRSPLRRAKLTTRPAVTALWPRLLPPGLGPLCPGPTATAAAGQTPPRPRPCLPASRSTVGLVACALAAQPARCPPHGRAGCALDLRCSRHWSGHLGLGAPSCVARRLGVGAWSEWAAPWPCPVPARLESRALALPAHVLLCSAHRAAVQRVVTAMTQMDQKKHEKFANQFNYALH